MQPDSSLVSMRRSSTGVRADRATGRRSKAVMLAVTTLWGAWVSGAMASTQSSAPRESPPATPPASEPAPAAPAKKEGQTPPATPKSEKTLDELLGLPGAKKATDEKTPNGEAGGAAEEQAKDALADQARARLERGLDERQMDSILQQALASMRASAEQLSERSDTGLSTQRAQADVVAKLDQLIEEAKRRSKSGKSNSSGSSSGAQGQQKPGESAGAKPGDENAQKPGESKTRANGKRSQNAGEERDGDAPAKVDPDSDQAAMDESQAEWGALPERIRDLIRQGSRDRIASLYQRLTEEYYRRMAEDASR